MKTTIEKQDEVLHTMQLKVEWAKIANDYQQMISGYADKELPGFRKGHVPAKIIESRFGK
ncbi:MAG: trigger factor family protein [Spartobacteria bacterium]|nr:trigger factor family protein [Spartobacteria bacterium]